MSINVLGLNGNSIEINTNNIMYMITDRDINGTRIELKTGEIFYPELEEKIVALTKKKGWQDRVIYSSFNHYSIMKIKEIDPEAKTGFLYADGTLNMPGYAAENEVNALHPAFYNLQFEGYMEDCAMYDIDVNVWTVNSEKDMLRCKELGVNAVITNYPDKAIKLYR